MPTLYEQDCDGKREEVRDKLYSLKDLVNDDRYLDDARAAEETMKRARHNVEQLLTRLDGLGYQFAWPRHAGLRTHLVIETEKFGLSLAAALAIYLLKQ